MSNKINTEYLKIINLLRADVKYSDTKYKDMTLSTVTRVYTELSNAQSGTGIDCELISDMESYSLMVYEIYNPDFIDDTFVIQRLSRMLKMWHYELNKGVQAEINKKP